MKHLVLLIVAGAGGWLLWRYLTRPVNEAEQVNAEVAAKQILGDQKRAAGMSAEVSFATVGDMPYAGTPLTVFNSAITTMSKGLTLFPKGQHSNPYTDIRLN